MNFDGCVSCDVRRYISRNKVYYRVSIIKDFTNGNEKPKK